MQRLGNTENTYISRIGLGCMALSGFYGTIPSEEESINVIHTALNNGINFFDTSDAYGPLTNEILLGKAFQSIPREQICLATKFGFRRKDGTTTICGSPEYAKEACQASLTRLGLSHIDLYYLHRVDINTPIEDTITAMAELVRDGKVKAIGLSECSIETLRRAHAIHPISAVQSEYSLFCLNPERGMLDTCRELGITFVAYSPLGRGFLSGKYKTIEDLEPRDWRRNVPRYQGENWERNMLLVKEVEKLAIEKGCTAAQIALSWVLRDDNVVAIPGTKNVRYLMENIDSKNVKLTDEDHVRLREILNSFPIDGDRYPESSMSVLEI